MCVRLCKLYFHIIQMLKLLKFKNTHTQRVPMENIHLVKKLLLLNGFVITYKHLHSGI